MPKRRTDIEAEIERIKASDPMAEAIAQWKAERYNIVYTGLRDGIEDDGLSYKQVRRDLDLLTGAYDAKRARQFKENIANALQRNGASEAMVDFFRKNVTAKEIQEHPEEFAEIGTALTTFYKRDGYEDMLDNVATSLADYVSRNKSRVLIPAEYGSYGEVLRRRWVSVDDLEALDGDAVRWGLEVAE